ncbi:hypothetical protein EYF80_007074 [Liparis tanakae]|uniref:Uncharacterized protein n=1 Tax=Liparis tanakae TaxID=230148 RepID=A0A4Z2IXF0_9TELE|nr:hypothetical protein EYF80_007074 [Liparis tanakae]
MNYEHTSVFIDTVGGQSVRLPCLGVSGVDGRLLHAAELGLTGVRGHGRGRRGGENVRIGPGRREGRKVEL